MIEWACWGCGEECLWPNRLPVMLPSKPCEWPPPFVFAPLEVPAAIPNGLLLVFLCAFFSRSSTFFLNCFASFSSANDRPARHCSSSKVWKKVRSWLYEKVS